MVAITADSPALKTIQTSTLQYQYNRFRVGTVRVLFGVSVNFGVDRNSQEL